MYQDSITTTVYIYFLRFERYINPRKGIRTPTYGRIEENAAVCAMGSKAIVIPTNWIKRRGVDNGV